jgi:hypothetical protein
MSSLIHHCTAALEEHVAAIRARNEESFRDMVNRMVEIDNQGKDSFHENEHTATCKP